MTTRCVVVIGHVDHGKTSLVRALTGIDTDRLAEEKARGLTIVPGYAHRRYPTGTVDFIDAPGHEDFIQGMISGASGARAALVVISAAEGMKAQTQEHLSIAALLGITGGVIALSKSDLLSADEVAGRVDTLRGALAGTPFAGVPVLPCSALTGAGLDAVHDALAALLAKEAPVGAPLHPFLPVDRVFSITGRGTIVTGTLQGAALTVGDSAVLQPSGQPVTIRGLESRGLSRDRIDAGERTAVNLRGIGVGEVARGAVLCVPESFASSLCMDAAVTMLPSASGPLRHMEEVRVHVGSGSQTGTVRVFGGGACAAGTTRHVQIRFRKPAVCFAGQRAILRRLSPPETLGGAVILDPAAQPTGSGDTARVAVLEAAQEGDVAAIANALCRAGRGIARGGDVARLSRLDVAEAAGRLAGGFAEVARGLFAPEQTIEAGTAAFLAALAADHARHPLRAFAPRTAIAHLGLAAPLLDHIEERLSAAGRIRRNAQGLALQGHDPMSHLTDAEGRRMVEIASAFGTAGLSPLPLTDVVQNTLDRDLFDLLEGEGTLVRLHNVALGQSLVFHAQTLEGAATSLRAAFPGAAPFTTSQARRALETSRRVIVPVLEHFDACGITFRQGDTRRISEANPVSPSAPGS